MSFPTGKANANNKKYSFPVTPFSKKNDSRIANFFRLRNIENDLNDFIKFQEAEHARFMQYAGDMIFRSMYIPFHATYANHPQYSPSGVTIAPALLRRVIERCAALNCRLLLDECFVDFLDAPEKFTAKPLLRDVPNLLILKAFTKLYGMAGARLGDALCADEAFLDAMRRAGPPWAVSHLALSAGLAALRETEYVERVRALVRTERLRLYGQLAALGLRVVPGEANFLLFRCETPLYEPLRERGLLIRRCGDFAGLDDAWYRAAVRTREDNERLVAALREVLA